MESDGSVRLGGLKIIETKKQPPARNGCFEFCLVFLIFGPCTTFLSKSYPYNKP